MQLSASKTRKNNAKNSGGILMKKIINGKMYDTETAEAICEFNTGDESDCEFIDECLYRKKTGEFFLVGRGGSCSNYAFKEWRGNIYFSPDCMPTIVPINENEAKKFIEAHGEVEDYERLFGEVKE